MKMAFQTQKKSMLAHAPALSRALLRTYACTNDATGGVCESCRQKREGILQRAAVSASPVHDVPPIVHAALRSPGQPLDAATRSYMEPRFGHDFSQVRVHSDARAAESAWAVNALAYTVGREVVFGAGQYAPGTAAGARLLAHELAHVAQQSNTHSIPHWVSRVSRPSEAAESEADTVAMEMTQGSLLSGQNATSRHSSGGLPKGLVRQPWAPISSTTVYRTAMPWPFNGYVINNSDEPVTVWSDERGFFTIAPGATSDRFSEDVDHIRDRQGRWYKIGANTVTVDADGEIDGYKCEASGPGMDCGQRLDPNTQGPLA